LLPEIHLPKREFLSLAGRRLRELLVLHGRWKTMTFLPALRHDRIKAPWFLVGPIIYALGSPLRIATRQRLSASTNGF
jgi:hypothetical protein